MKVYNNRLRTKVFKKSRCDTRDLIRSGIITLKHKCKHKEDIERHHEIYPKTKELIIKAIKEEKIYYLCRKCHIEWHMKNIIDDEDFKICDDNLSWGGITPLEEEVSEKKYLKYAENLK